MKIILRFAMGLLWIGIGIQRLVQQSYPLALLFWQEAFFCLCRLETLECRQAMRGGAAAFIKHEGIRLGTVRKQTPSSPILIWRLALIRS